MVTETVKSPSVAGASQAIWAPAPEISPPDACQVYFSGFPLGLSTSTVTRLVPPGSVTMGSATSDVIRCILSPAEEPEPELGDPDLDPPPLAGGAPEPEFDVPEPEFPPFAVAWEPGPELLDEFPEPEPVAPADTPGPGFAAPGPGVGTLVELPELGVVVPAEALEPVDAPRRLGAAESPPLGSLVD